MARRAGAQADEVRRRKHQDGSELKGRSTREARRERFQGDGKEARLELPRWRVLDQFERRSDTFYGRTRLYHRHSSVDVPISTGPVGFTQARATFIPAATDGGIVVIRSPAARVVRAGWTRPVQKLISGIINARASGVPNQS